MALLVHLAAAVPGGLHRRDTLLALFWPELDETHARAALSQALYVLRNALGDQGIVTRGDDEVGLSRARHTTLRRERARPRQRRASRSLDRPTRCAGRTALGSMQRGHGSRPTRASTARAACRVDGGHPGQRPPDRQGGPYASTGGRAVRGLVRPTR